MPVTKYSKGERLIGVRHRYSRWALCASDDNDGSCGGGDGCGGGGGGGDCGGADFNDKGALHAMRRFKVTGMKHEPTIPASTSEKLLHIAGSYHKGDCIFMA